MLDKTLAGQKVASIAFLMPGTERELHIASNNVSNSKQFSVHFFRFIHFDLKLTCPFHAGAYKKNRYYQQRDQTLLFHLDR